MGSISPGWVTIATNWCHTPFYINTVPNNLPSGTISTSFPGSFISPPPGASEYPKLYVLYMFMFNQEPSWFNIKKKSKSYFLLALTAYRWCGCEISEIHFLVIVVLAWQILACFNMAVRMRKVPQGWPDVGWCSSESLAFIVFFSRKSPENCSIYTSRGDFKI